MKLYLNATSPYSRFIRILLIEKDLEDSVEFIWCDPWQDDPELQMLNPIGKIPTLITDQGIAICESLLIAQFLDQAYPTIPMTSSTQQTLNFAGVAQGMIDAAFAFTIDSRFDPESSASKLNQRRLDAILRALADLELKLKICHETTLNQSSIALAVAIEYIRFRLPHLMPQAKYPMINYWLTPLIQRDSFKQTAVQ